jgi:hypothetical protein
MPAEIVNICRRHRRCRLLRFRPRPARGEPIWSHLELAVFPVRRVEMTGPATHSWGLVLCGDGDLQKLRTYSRLEAQMG